MTAGRTITIFGHSLVEEGTPLFTVAERLGFLLAKENFIIANGGYGGTMLASARGTKNAGGQCIGVTCRAFTRKVNPYVTTEISTEDLEERLKKLIELGDAYLVLEGGTGTLLELADVWEHKNKGFAKAKKPIILVGDFWTPLAAMMARTDPRTGKCISMANDADQAVQILKEALL